MPIHNSSHPNTAAANQITTLTPEQAGIDFSFESCTRFFNSVVIRGTARSRSGSALKIRSVGVANHPVSAIVGNFELEQSGATRFLVQMLASLPDFPKKAVFIFDIEGKGLIGISWVQIKNHSGRSAIGTRFRELLKNTHSKDMLDIGGRARSGSLRTTDYENINVEVLDIFPGDGVSVVCDAHEMSQYLEPNRFDAVISISVFEHLAMPWKVAVEMSRVMKVGAVGLIVSHQTLGMHDMPWDFFRFSDSGWKGIFNAHTGFEILETELSGVNHIVPFFWDDRYEDSEKTAGYEISAVLIRKISPSTVDWPLSAADVTKDMYPAGEYDRPSNLIQT